METEKSSLRGLSVSKIIYDEPAFMEFANIQGKRLIRKNDDINEAFKALNQKIRKSFTWEKINWSKKLSEFKSDVVFERLAKRINPDGTIDKALSSDCYCWDVMARLRDSICGKKVSSDIKLMNELSQKEGDILCEALKVLAESITSSCYYTDGTFELEVRKKCQSLSKDKKTGVKSVSSEKIVNFGVIRQDDKCCPVMKEDSKVIMVTAPTEKAEPVPVEDNFILPPIGTILWVLDNGNPVRCEVVNPKRFDKKTTMKRSILILDGKYESVWSPSPSAIVDLVWGKNKHNGWKHVRIQLVGVSGENTKKAMDVMSRNKANRVSYVNGRVKLESGLVVGECTPDDDVKRPSVKEFFTMPSLETWKSAYYVKQRVKRAKVASVGDAVYLVDGELKTSGKMNGSASVLGVVSSVCEEKSPLVEVPFSPTPLPLEIQLKQKMQELCTAYSENRITRSDLNHGLDELEGVSKKIETVEIIRKDIESRTDVLFDLETELVALGFTV